MKWWEFDSGYLVLRVLAFLRLAKINHVDRLPAGADDPRQPRMRRHATGAAGQ